MLNMLFYCYHLPSERDEVHDVIEGSRCFQIASIHIHCFLKLLTPGHRVESQGIEVRIGQVYDSTDNTFKLCRYKQSKAVGGLTGVVSSQDGLTLLIIYGF